MPRKKRITVKQIKENKVKLHEMFEKMSDIENKMDEAIKNSSILWEYGFRKNDITVARGQAAQKLLSDIEKDSELHFVVEEYKKLVEPLANEFWQLHDEYEKLDEDLNGKIEDIY